MKPVRVEPAAIQAQLKSRRFGHKIESHLVIGSTNTRARQLASASCPEGTVVLADSQEHGRGRSGRTWASPPGCNLYCSLVLRPDLRSAQAPLLTLAAGLATAETVGEWVGGKVGIKWPNDVLIGGRKVAGILTEMENDDERVRFVILGIGVNLNASESDFPPALRNVATSVALWTGHPVDRPCFCAVLLANLETRYRMLLEQGFETIVSAWNQWDLLAGQEVQVQTAGGDVVGRGSGLSPEGSLRLETREGVRDIVAGDVRVLAAGKVAVR